MAIIDYNSAIQNTINEEMRRDPNILILGPSVIGEPSIAEFGKNRVINTGISETAACAAGIGAAMVGGRPIVDTMWSPFLLDAAGQVINQAAVWRFKLGNTVDIPVIFKQGYGMYNYGLGVQHSHCLHNLFANVPGVHVAVPSFPSDAIGLWRTALRYAKNPTMMWEPLPCIWNDGGIREDVPEGDYTIPFGKGDVKRKGKDVTIAAVGYMVHIALKAAEALAGDGIDAEVWDPRTLTPFDREGLIASVKKTGRMVVVDQAPKTFGTTGEFMATVAEAGISPAPSMARVAMMDVPIGFARTLEQYILPDKDKIIRAVKKVVNP